MPRIIVFCLMHAGLIILAKDCSKHLGKFLKLPPARSFLFPSYLSLLEYWSLCSQLGEITMLYLDSSSLKHCLESASRQRARVHFICFPLSETTILYFLLLCVWKQMFLSLSHFHFLGLEKKNVSSVVKSPDCLSNKVIWSCCSVPILRVQITALGH